MRPYIVQPIHAHDIQEVLDIENKSFPSPWTRGMFLGELSNPLSRAFIARRWDLGIKVLGYLFYQVVAFEMHILNLAVHPSFRAMGIGKTLLTSSLEREKDNNAARYAFLEVRADNKNAIQMYSGIGFKQLGVRKKYYAREGGNALIMGKPIA